MKKMSIEKQERLKRLTDEAGIISALAIDQRGALKKMINQYKEATSEDIIQFKQMVSQYLTPYASAILLDPEYGLPAAALREKECDLLLAYEKTGYDTKMPGRLPDLLNIWSVKRLKEAGADACKFLLYYDVDEPAEINVQKQIVIERIGSECEAEGMLAVALIGLALAMISYKNDQNKDHRPLASEPSHSVEGEIEDDEI